MEKMFTTSDGWDYVISDCSFIDKHEQEEPIYGIHAIKYDKYNQKCWEAVCGQGRRVSEIETPEDLDNILENEYWDEYYETLESVQIV